MRFPIVGAVRENGSVSKRWFALAGALLLWAGLSAPAHSQTTTGRILGSVHDTQDASIVGAKITFTDSSRGTTRVVVTDETGEYVAADLQPSTYKVFIEAKGFNSYAANDLLLEVGKDIRLDAKLKAGDSTQVITIIEDIPLLDTTSSTLGGTMSNKEINDLPLNGRNYENLLQLRPGVVRYPGGGFSTTSSNGLRAEDNAYLIDGLFNSEPFSGQSIINGAGIAGDSATILPIDAIQEFNVVQSPPAEYGWKPGANVNVGLKSGTNTLHGTAYGFGRTTTLDARNFYNPIGQEKSPRNLKQFGATVGGPIVKDKLFFFGAYEGQRYTVGNVGQLNTPATVGLATPVDNTGAPAPNCTFIATGDCANSIVNAIQDVHAAHLADPVGNPFDVSPVSLQIAGCTADATFTNITCNGSGLPLNGGTNPAGPTTINYGLPNSVSVDNALGKVDYQLNAQNTISGIYFYGDNNGTVQDASQLQTKWLTRIHTRAQVTGVNWIWTPSSEVVNEARFGYNRLYQPTFPNDVNSPASSYGLNTGVTNPLYGGLPRINVLPFFSFPLGGIGGFNWPKVQGPDTRYQFVDHITRIEGKHSFKFGGELHHDGFTGAAYGGTRGRFKFLGGTAFAAGAGSTPLEDFFAGAPLNGSLLIGDPTRHIHNWGIALFAQDDWRVTSHLTVNYGLRYELSTVIKDSNNQLANFDPNQGLLQVGHGIDGPYNRDPYNFAPRAGFAWDINGNNRTVLRGGAGIIYETVNWEAFLALNNNIGLSTIPTAAATGVTPGTGNIATGLVTFPGSQLNWNGTGGGTVFPTAPVDCSVATGNPCTIMGITQNFKTPIVYEWNLNVQHAITPKVTLEMAYVGNHGSKLLGIRDVNQPTVGAGWAGCIASDYDPVACGNPPAADGGAEQNARPFNAKFPYLAQIYQVGNIYRSNYDGLQLTLTGREYHGFSYLLGYTYSHSLDNVGANWDFGAGSGLPMNSMNARNEYASSDFDMRHRFTLSLTYAIPGVKTWGQLLEGWQVNTIVALYGKQPWGPIDAGTDVSGTGELVDRWNFFGKPSDFKPTISSGVPYFGGTSNAACAAKALALDNGTAGPNTYSLNTWGCYAVGSSMMLPPALGTFGNMGRNIFRDFGFKNVDFSAMKNFSFGERAKMQFRAEFFNIFNHPNFANPFGGQNGWGHNDPSVPGAGGFGCSCATPDVAASNPVIGSGGSRAVQLGLKFTF